MHMFMTGDVSISILLATLLGYLLGSIPIGLLLTKAAGMGDVRSIGSGNIGATNVLRTGNKGLAAATLLLDLAKGFAPVFIAQQVWGGPTVAFASGAAVIGHCFPVWLKFKGGKGQGWRASGGDGGGGGPGGGGIQGW